MADPFDVRDTEQWLPVRDDASASPVAQRATRVLVQALGRGPDEALATVLELDRLSDDDLEGVQALGMGVAAFASTLREARAARG